jgi:hypothetical protein
MPRTEQDILVFAKRYADLVKYYDVHDKIDWVDFDEGVITGPCIKRSAAKVANS